MDWKNFSRRLKKFWNLAPEQNIIYLVSRPADIFYLLGIEPDEKVFLTVGPKRNELNLFCPALYADVFLKQSPKLVKVNSFLLEEKYLWQKKQPVAINPKNISAEFLLRLKRKLKNRLRFYDFTDTWRTSKEPSEIRKIYRAAKITSQLLKQVRRQIHRGTSEKDIASGIVKRLSAYGGEPAFEPIVAFGKNSAYPHHRSGNTCFSGEGPVLIDLGCRFQGYCSDITRTYYFGRVNPQFLRVYRIVARAKIAAEKAIATGKNFSEIDQVARQLVTSYGFEKNFVHGIGHGVGIEVHEAPDLKKFPILEENMVFTIEPGIYLPGKFGVRLEDTILLTKSGAKILTIG